METRLGPSSRLPQALADAVWPGENWAILVVEEAGKAWYVTEELRKMKRRREIHRAGLRAFVQDGELMV